MHALAQLPETWLHTYPQCQIHLNSLLLCLETSRLGEFDCVGSIDYIAAGEVTHTDQRESRFLIQYNHGTQEASAESKISSCK